MIKEKSNFPNQNYVKTDSKYQNIKLCFCISIAVTSAPIHPNKAKAIESYTFDWAV